MSRSNTLLQSPPYPVEHAVRQLGENLRVARIRRSMRIADAAERIGTGPRAVMDAEKGKSSTGIVVYAALLWLYDQLDQLEEIGEPSKDKEGLSLAAANERQRVRKGKGRGLDGDF
jgi:transcriptional regulator with XRE-family HTH domain